MSAPENSSLSLDWVCRSCSTWGLTEPIPKTARSKVFLWAMMLERRLWILGTSVTTAVATVPESVSERAGERLAASVAALMASPSSAVCSSILRTVGIVVRRLPLNVLRVLFRVVMWFSMLVMAWSIDAASL